ncbi:TPA: hypothetical protein ACFNMI_002202 [Neisseria bacilliformis]|uniref:Putative phage associated protein n=1 Tax=Neisseria bacilliformis ATCC BAA-1200 TaxID=888742 RepID=F2BD93_9NEIS|nr:hypothetical protein [Neisseria bacilliformis]EGF10489.1 putative phage associated protein [Neisseria bacilliformis ATCC BAA-1200]QMT48625.1 hypothetical protein H3L91_05965 [Neisseria bacilliformis]DAX35393.1 MAG TPA: terminase small subunit [Caudoviricetes sp.]
MKTDKADIMERICELLAAGQSMAQICRSKAMPAQSTVYRWIAESAEFSERYAHAREMQADMLADEIIEIADSCEPEAAAVAKAKARIDARKWLAARLAPKKYGDRVDVSAGVAVKVETRSLADIFSEPQKTEGQP